MRLRILSGTQEGALLVSACQSTTANACLFALCSNSSPRKGRQIDQSPPQVRSQRSVGPGAEEESPGIVTEKRIGESAQSAMCRHLNPRGQIPMSKTDVVVHICNPSPRKVETGGFLGLLDG